MGFEPIPRFSREHGNFKPHLFCLTESLSFLYNPNLRSYFGSECRTIQCKSGVTLNHTGGSESNAASKTRTRLKVDLYSLQSGQKVTRKQEANYGRRCETSLAGVPKSEESLRPMHVSANSEPVAQLDRAVGF